MYKVDAREMSPAFFHCWKAAGLHLERCGDGAAGWLRSHPYPPFLDHLSFRLGNQIFVVHIEDASGKVAGPGSKQGLLTLARIANAHPCVLPMRQALPGGTWVPTHPGWGLLHAESRQPLDPVALVTDERVAMTPWELHDFAVQVVRDHLAHQGAKVVGYHSHPDVDPAIWLTHPDGRSAWVAVRAAPFPSPPPSRPANWHEIVAQCAGISQTGHFASVVVASADQPFETEDEPPVPLWRGHALTVQFTGLQ